MANQPRSNKALSLSNFRTFSAKNILLIENKQSYIDLIREAIEQIQISPTQYCLHAFTNSEEALNFLYRQKNYFQSPRPELILLDLNLPKMDGFEFLSIVKQDPTLKLIPIVVLTGSINPNDIVRSYMLHANSYVNKPLEPEQFFQVIQTIVSFWLTIAASPPT